MQDSLSGQTLAVAIGTTNQKTRLQLENILALEPCRRYAILADATQADVDILDASYLPPAEFWACYRQNPERHKIVITVEAGHGAMRGAYFLRKPIESGVLAELLRRLSAYSASSVAGQEVPRDYDSLSFTLRKQHFYQEMSLAVMS